MKTFRSVKFGTLAKNSPSGNRYVFTRTTDVVPISKEDEDWMMNMCGHKEGNLLAWSNPPEDVAKMMEDSVKRQPNVIVADTFGYKEPKPVPEFHSAKTAEQIEYEIMEAKKLEEPIPLGEPKIEESVTVEKAFEEEPEVIGIDLFTTELAKAEDIAKFVKDMKIEFNIKELTEICTEVGIEYEGTKAEVIEKLIVKIGE